MRPTPSPRRYHALTGPSYSVQCIGEAFGVDPTDEQQAKRLSVKPATLQTIFDVFLKTRDRVQPASAAASSAPAQPKTPTPEDIQAADGFKADGNKHMTSKAYDKAIESYTKAIELAPTNAVFYSNRAAAHISQGNLAAAVADSEKAIEVNPEFVRSYSRLGYVASLIYSARFSCPSVCSSSIGYWVLTSPHPSDMHITRSATTRQPRLRISVDSRSILVTRLCGRTSPAPSRA